MLKAIDANNELVFIDEAIRENTYYCQVCKQALIQRRGEIKIHHFAHKSAHGANKEYLPCSDSWANKYDMTDWHYEWQKKFDYKDIEKVVSIGNDKHIADVIVGDIVVEFQHSNISIEHFRERNEFYTKAGYKVIWVFDLIEEYDNQRITFEMLRDNQYRWSHAKKLFKNIDVDNEKATIFIQLSDSDEDKVIERLYSSYNEFSVFYTDLNNALTKQEFVDYIKSNNNKLFPKPKPPKAPDKIEGGKTINQLWEDTYQWMIVNNLFNKTKMIIRGENGEIYRERFVDYYPRIVGKYIHYNSKENKYVYEDDFSVVYDSDKQIWSLESKRIDEKLVEKKNHELEERRKREEENKKRIEEERIRIEKIVKEQEYCRSIPREIEDGLTLEYIIRNNLKKNRKIINLYTNECYYFTFEKGQAFMDKVVSIKEYNKNTDEIGKDISKEDLHKINMLYNYKIWDNIH